VTAGARCGLPANRPELRFRAEVPIHTECCSNWFLQRLRFSIMWDWQGYFSIVTWPVENTSVNSFEKRSFSLTVTTPCSSSSSVFSTNLTACQKEIWR